VAIASNGSPFSDSANKRLSASKKPGCPIAPSQNHVLGDQIRTARRGSQLFEMPY
jgi:hypothetical protein